MRLAATRPAISAGSAVGDCAAADAAIMTSPNSMPKNLHIDACSPPGDIPGDPIRDSSEMCCAFPPCACCILRSRRARLPEPAAVQEQIDAIIRPRTRREGAVREEGDQARG